MSGRSELRILMVAMASGAYLENTLPQLVYKRFDNVAHL